MKDDSTPKKGGVYRLGLFVLFVICGLLIFMFGSSYYSVFPTNDSLIYKTSLPAIFLAATLLLYRHERLKKYWQISFAFFVASFANWVLAVVPLGAGATSAESITLDKLAQFIKVVIPMIALTKLAGGDMGSIYLKKGNLKLGLFIGSSMLLINLSSGFMVGASQEIAPETLFSIMPWALGFSLINAFMEELWFRGLFLRKMEPFIGANGANLVTSIVFTLSHVGALYVSPEQIPFFLAIVFPLALLYAYLMQKTDSAWGSVLFHAGSDVFWFLGMGF